MTMPQEFMHRAFNQVTKDCKRRGKRGIVIIKIILVMPKRMKMFPFFFPITFTKKSKSVLRGGAQVTRNGRCGRGRLKNIKTLCYLR